MIKNLEILSTYGNTKFLKEVGLSYIGIVGSRSIINYTSEILDELFLFLKELKVCIISGGMYGVDMYVHNLCIANNIPTIIVLPCGVESYLKSSLFTNLKFKTPDEFCMVSQYSENFVSRKYSFLERNKMIVEWSDLILVAQSAEKSGSIFTGNYSLKINKPTFAIPISLDRKQFQGNNSLISKGANIYTSPESICKNITKKAKFVIPSFETLSKFLPNKIDQLLIILNEYEPNLIEESLLKLVLEGKIFYENEIYYVNEGINDK